MRPIRLLCLAALAALLASCAGPTPQAYAQQTPTLDITRYFNGTLDAHGMFQDRSGEVVKRFVVLMHCQWQGEHGTLDEAFSYADGTQQRRIWSLTRTGAQTFTATAADVVGVAHGSAAGNALRWNYVLALPVDGKIVNVDMEDWMFLIDDKVMLKRTAMSKFGANLGSVTLSFQRRAP